MKASKEYNDMFEMSSNFIPNARLENIENSLPETEQEFIDNDKVKETMINLYKNAMDTKMVKNRIENINKKWQILVNGQEASRVIVESMNIIPTIMHVLLTETSKEEMETSQSTTMHDTSLSETDEQKMKTSKLSNIFTNIFNLLTSSEMPVIINNVGGVIIKAVNKPYAPQFVVQFWIETMSLIQKNPDLNTKLNKLFKNMITIMQVLYKQNTLPTNNYLT